METTSANVLPTQKPWESPVKKKQAKDVVLNLLKWINADEKALFYRELESYLGTVPIGSYYRTLDTLLKNRPRQLTALTELKADVKKLLQFCTPADENVFLNPGTQKLIDELVFEWQNAETYKYHNLGVRHKILLHGPTGNGKTTLARHIARQINLPFVEVSSDLVIEAKLGTSSTNIANIFNQVKQPCILFWDEVDSIGRKRGYADSSAGMENERMINSILVNLEKLSADVIFVAATNRREVLDPAFLRRFDLQYEVALPTTAEKENFKQQLISYYKLPHNFLSQLNVEAMQSLSEIKTKFLEEARSYVSSILKTSKNDA